MSENIRQRKRLDESNEQSLKTDLNRGITLDRDDRRKLNRSTIPVS